MPALHRQEKPDRLLKKRRRRLESSLFRRKQRDPPYTVKIPQLSRISRNTSSGRIPAARIS